MRLRRIAELRVRLLVVPSLFRGLKVVHDPSPPQAVLDPGIYRLDT